MRLLHLLEDSKCIQLVAEGNKEKYFKSHNLPFGGAFIPFPSILIWGKSLFFCLFPFYAWLKTHCNLSPDVSMLWIRPYSNRHRLICVRHLYYLLPAAVMCNSYISLFWWLQLMKNSFSSFQILSKYTHWM